MYIENVKTGGWKYHVVMNVQVKNRRKPKEM
jgi:hypothetical protein